LHSAFGYLYLHSDVCSCDNALSLVIVPTMFVTS